MDCKFFENNILLYLDAELDKEQMIETENHLAVCTQCRTYLNQIKPLYLTLGENTKDLTTSPYFYSKLINKLESEIPQKQTIGWMPKRVFRPVLYVTLSIVLLLSVVEFININNDQPTATTVISQATPIDIEYYSFSDNNTFEKEYLNFIGDE
jgi:predicted anti-sigma-YlaC factor YlaD